MFQRILAGEHFDGMLIDEPPLVITARVGVLRKAEKLSEAIELLRHLNSDTRLVLS